MLTKVPEVEILWKNFLESFDEDLKKQFLNRDAIDPKITMKISENGVSILHQIQEHVTRHFTENCYFTLQINDWLQTEQPEMIIVRSTGKEDTEDNSNAGGNESIPFIAADPMHISTTIGRVLASYFGEKSVSQRLLAGDKSLLTEEIPFLPVLLQTMVMEQDDDEREKSPDDIPRSGVLFTNQMNTARDVTLIQTGIGNNEGVVSSQVPVDSYYGRE